MKSLSYQIDQMNRLFDNLIEIAKNLRDITLQVLNEEEILMYQLKQKELLAQIETVNQILETNYLNQVDEVDHHRLQAKMHLFQALNQEYIQNLKKNHGLIQFDLSYAGEQHEESDRFTHQLTKVLPSPNSTQAIKPKKTKKS